MNYPLAFKTFFGITPECIGDSVIVTNISSIYSALIDSAFSVGPCQKGIYNTTELWLNNNKCYNTIKITPGNNAIDVVKLLTLYVNKLYFIGIAGCLDSNLSIGDVCEPSKFASVDSLCDCCNLTICQTSGLIQTNDFFIGLREKGVCLVDMECYDVYRICKDNNVQLKYIVQVSDFPLKTPFYKLHPQPIRIKQILEKFQDEQLRP